MNFSLRKDFYFLAALFLLAAVLFGFRLGGFGLLDPDEPFYALTAKEMLHRGDISTPVIFGAPQFEKPIFFYDVLYVCFKLFGVHEWSARLGPCLAGILTVLITYLWGRVLFRRPLPAFLSAAILATAAEYVVVSRVVLTDIYLCLFVTAALYAFTLGYFEVRHRAWAWRLLFVFSALGFLTKGILGFLLPFMAVVFYLALSGETGLLAQMPWCSGLLLFAAIGFPWYALMTARYGTDFLRHFFIHENIRRFFVAEHGSFDRFYFYPGGVLLGFFPWTFALPSAVFFGFKKARGTGAGRRFLLLIAVFLSFFAFFMTAKSKLLSYIFPVFPATALFLGGWAYAFFRSCRSGGKTAGIFPAAFAVLGVVPAALAAGVYVFGRKMQIDLGLPLFLFCAGVVPLFWASLFFLKKKRLETSFFLLVGAMVCFGLVSFGLLLPDVDTLFASRDLVQTYEKDAGGKGTGLFIAGKFFVRGVSFYSGNPKMAVITDDPHGAFYTKHSIPMISSTQDLLNLPASAFPAYCFLREKEFVFLKTIVNDRFKMIVLDDTPQRALVRLERT